MNKASSLFGLNILYFIHITSVLIFFLIHILVPDDSLVRWNLDMVCVIISVVSGVMSFFCLLATKIRSLVIKNLLLTYFAVYSVAVLSISFGFYTLGLDMPKVAESEHYTVHHKAGGIDEGSYNLYKKEGIVEHYCQQLASDEIVYLDLDNFHESGSSVSFDLICCDSELCDSMTKHFVVPVKK